MRRKTRIALLLAFLTALAGVAASVAVQAASDVPGKATFAPRHVGDAGEYRRTVLDADGDVVSDELAFRFRWLAAEQVHDWDGALRLTNPVMLSTPTIAEPLLETHYLDASDMGREVASVRQEGDLAETVLVPIVPALGSSTASSATERVSIPRLTSGAHVDLPCPVTLRPAGRTVALGDLVELFEPCQGPHRNLYDPTFRAVRTDQLGGRDVLVFDGRTEGSRALGLGNPTGAWAWVDPSLPVPVQVAQQDGAHTVVHRLVRFERGSAPLAGPAEPGPVLPEVVLAPRQPWGMDDAGIDHAWPLSLAWTHAYADPLASGMRDWLADHPQAYTAYAEGRTVFIGSEREIEWRWVLADGTDQLTVGHSRIDAMTPAVAGPLAPLVPPTTDVRYAYDNRTFSDEPMRFPARDELAHPLLPTVASLAGHWRAHSGADGPLDAWSFTDECYSNTCASQDAERSIGTYRWHGEAVGGSALSVVSGWDLDYDLLKRDHPFTADVPPFLEVVRIRSDAVDLTVAGIAVDGEAASPPEGMVVAAGAWQASDPTGIAAVGMLAAVVFLAVRFGGALLGAPLFSRIQGPDLLEHPLRRALHQAVEANPGIHLKALARTVGRPRNTVEHHVRKLVASGLLTQHELNGYACLFVKGQVDRRDQAAAGVLKSDAARRVLAAVVQAPGASGRDVAAQAGLTPTLVSYHVRNLQQAGLVEGQRAGRELRLQATELGRKAAA
jgi:predicted transcriptional regulator